MHDAGTSHRVTYRFRGCNSRPILGQGTLPRTRRLVGDERNVPPAQYQGKRTRDESGGLKESRGGVVEEAEGRGSTAGPGGDGR